MSSIAVRRRVGLEAETQRAVGVDLHRRLHTQVAEERCRALGGLPQLAVDVLMDRSGERGGQALLRRGPHEVAVGDEHLVAGSLLGRAENQGRLPVAPRRVDEDVLPVPHVGDQLPQLVLTIGKSPVERERAEGERVRMAHNIMERYIR